MNLAAMPNGQRAETERDKQRWFRAWQMIRTKRPPEIRAWLARIEDEAERDDWRCRLNTIKNRKKPKKSTYTSPSGKHPQLQAGV